jgi:hypothetical protein
MRGWLYAARRSKKRSYAPEVVTLDWASVLSPDSLGTWSTLLEAGGGEPVDLVFCA